MKTINFNGFSNLHENPTVIELEKAAQEGIYADTPSNRKLGRVGMSYKQYTAKVEGKDTKSDPKENDKSGGEGSGKGGNFGNYKEAFTGYLSKVKSSIDKVSSLEELGEVDMDGVNTYDKNELSKFEGLKTKIASGKASSEDKAEALKLGKSLKKAEAFAFADSAYKNHSEKDNNIPLSESKDAIIQKINDNIADEYHHLFPIGAKKSDSGSTTYEIPDYDPAENRKNLINKNFDLLASKYHSFRNESWKQDGKDNWSMDKPTSKIDKDVLEKIAKTDAAISSVLGMPNVLKLVDIKHIGILKTYSKGNNLVLSFKRKSDNKEFNVLRDANDNYSIKGKMTVSKSNMPVFENLEGAPGTKKLGWVKEPLESIILANADTSKPFDKVK